MEGYHRAKPRMMSANLENAFISVQPSPRHPGQTKRSVALATGLVGEMNHNKSVSYLATPSANGDGRHSIGTHLRCSHLFCTKRSTSAPSVWPFTRLTHQHVCTMSAINISKTDRWRINESLYFSQPGVHWQQFLELSLCQDWHEKVS